MTKLREWLTRKKEKFEENFGPLELIGDAFNVFFFKEVLYVILPLIIVVLIRIMATGKINFLKFLSSSLFSFAIVLIFAFSIPCFIELKKKQNELSNRLTDGVKRNILFLIISVVVLSFAFIVEEKYTKMPLISDTIIVFINSILFPLGISNIFKFQYSEKLLEYKKNHIDVLKSFNDISFFLRTSIEKSYDELIYFIYFLEGFTIDVREGEKVSKKDFLSSKIYNGKEIEIIEDYIQRTKKKIALAEKIFKKRKKVLFQKHKISYMEEVIETTEEKCEEETGDNN